MAKKNLGSFNNTGSGKDFNFNFDDASSQFDNFNFDDHANTNTRNNRDPILQVRQGISAGLSSSLSAFIPGLSQRVSRSMPDAAKFYGEVGNFTSDLMYMGNQLQQDVAPIVQQLKRAGRTLGPRIKQFLPKSAYSKFDSLVSDSDDQAQANAKMGKAAAENQAIAASLDSVFKQQLKTQAGLAEDQKADTILDRALASKRHTESFQQLQAMRAGTAFNQSFIQSIQIPYMKKDLELKYRHYFVAKDTLSVLQGMSKLVEKKLDEIRHNTGLPEIQKLTRMEGVKEVALRRFSAMSANWAGNMLKKLQSRVLDPFKEGLTMAGDAAEMMADSLSTMDEMTGVKSAGAQTGSIGGMLAGGYLAKKTGKFLFGEQYGKKGLLSNHAASLNNLFKNGTTRLGLRLQQLANEREGSFLGELFSILSPDFLKGAGRTSNVQLKDPDAPATMTNAFALSVTSVMPGYLAKMTKLLEEIKTGKPAEELVYDRDSNDFVRVSTIQKKFAHEAFGTAEQRRQRTAKNIGTIRGMYRVTSQGDTASFTEVEEDFGRMIENCKINKIIIDPGLIKEFSGIFKKIEADKTDADDYSFDFEADLRKIEAEERAQAYIRNLFKGTQHPYKLLTVLSTMLFDSTGHVDRQTLSTLNDMLVEEMRDDQYLDVYSKYINKYGMARHLKPFISSSTNGQFTHNERALREQMRSGVDYKSDEFRRDRDMMADQSSMYQSEIRSSMSLKELLEDPDLRGGAVGWILDKVGDHGKLLTDNISKWSTTAKDRWNNDIRSNIPKEWQDWATKAMSTSHGKAADIRKALSARGDRAALIMKLRRLKEEHPEYISAERKAFDPYLQGGADGGDVFNSMGGGMSPFMLASILGGSGPTFIPTAPLGRQQPSAPSQAAHTTTNTTTVNGGEEITDAIHQFEATFKEYAEKQVAVPDLLSKMLDISGAMSTQLDAVIGNTRSTVGKAFGWAKKHASIKAVGSLAKGMVTVPWGITKWGGRQVGKLGSHIPGMASWAWNEGLPGIGRGIASGGRLLGKGAGIAGGAMKDLTLGTLSALGLSSDVLAGKTMSGLQWLRDSKFNIKKGFGESKKMLSQKFKDKVFVDIYVKDKVDPGNPILSKRQQMDGVVFVDSGKKLMTSYAITRPIMDPETKEILVTEQNIKDGLVDIDNHDLGGSRTFVGKAFGGAMSLVKGGWAGAKGIGKTFLGLISGGIPMQDLIGKMMGLGLDGVRMAGRGVSTLAKRLFGVSEGINPDHLKAIVGDKLDIIISIMREKFNIPGDGKASGTGNKSLFGGPRPGDEDGDGKVDTIFQARKRTEEEKAKKKEDAERSDFYSTMKSIKDGIVGKKGEKKGLLDSIKGLFGAGGIFGSIAGILGGIKSTVGFIGSGVMKLLSFVGTIGRLLGRGVAGLGKGAFSIGKGLLRRFSHMGKFGKLAALVGGAFAASSLFGGDDSAEAAEMSMPEDHDIDDGGQEQPSTLTGRAMDYGMMAGGMYAAGKVGSAAMKKLAIRAGGRAATRAAVAGAGASSGPAGWLIGGGLLALDVIDSVVFDGKYSQNVYNWIGIGTDEFAEARCALYGVDTAWKAKNLMGDGTLRQTIKLEDAIYEIAEKKAKPFTDSDFEEWTNRFGLSSADPDQVKFWVTWYRRRFLPICKSYLKALTENKVAYSDVHSATDAVKNKILSTMQGECGTVIQNTQNLVPTPEAYAEFKKREQAWKDDTSENSTKAKQAAMEKAREDKVAADKAGQGSGKYDLSASQAGAAYSTNVATGVTGSYTQLRGMAKGNTSIDDMLTGAGFNAAKGNSFVASNYGVAGRMMGAMTGSAAGAVDLSKVNPAQLTGQPGELGSYVQRFESGGKGTAAIAYDSAGGTSYGSFQLSSRHQSLHEFVAWCQNKAPEVYRVLSPLLPKSNTGSTHGEFPTAWLQLVQAGKITYALEHEYYSQKFYGTALSKLQKAAPEIAQFVQSNRAIQECLWSVAVQHGPGGAVNMFKNIWKPNITPEQFLRALYSERYTSKYFNELSKSDPGMLRGMATRRGPEELGVMLALLGQNPADGSGAPGGEAPAGALTASAGAPGGGAMPSGGAGGGQANPTPDADAFTAPSINSGSGAATGPIGGGAGGGEGLSVQGGADIDNIHPALKERLQGLGKDFAAQFGQPLTITSGKRTMEKQAELYQSKGPGLAAKPSPFAPHIAGIAVDANSSQVNQAADAGLLQKYGLWQPLKNGLGGTGKEPWHIELQGSRDPQSMRITPGSMAAINQNYGAGVSPDVGTDKSSTGAAAVDTSAGGFSAPSLQNQYRTNLVSAHGSPAAMQQYSYPAAPGGGAEQANLGSGGQPTQVNDPALNQQQTAQLAGSEAIGILKDILQVIQSIFSSGESIPELLEKLVSISQEMPGALTQMASSSSGSGGGSMSRPTTLPGFQPTLTGEKTRRALA